MNSNIKQPSQPPVIGQAFAALVEAQNRMVGAADTQTYPEPKREPAIPRQIGRLNGMLDSLEKVVCQLAERLDPVIVPRPVKPEAPEKGEPPPTAPLADQIEVAAVRVARQITNLQDILEALEI